MPHYTVRCLKKYTFNEVAVPSHQSERSCISMFSFIYNNVFAHRDKKEDTSFTWDYCQYNSPRFYQLMKSSSSPWSYITNVTHTHMEKSVHINESIPVTITRVNENRKTGEKKFFRLSILCDFSDWTHGT